MNVLYIGPFKTTKSVVGGYATANERLCNALIKKKVFVEKLSYYSEGGNVGKKILGYIISSFYIIIGLFKFSFKKYKNKVVHITGLYKYFIYFEYILLGLCKFLKIPTVYDIRAGSAQLYYTNGSALYKILFRRSLISASDVAVEGDEMKDWVCSIIGHEPHYLPNFVEDSGSELAIPIPKKDITREIVFMYFGRITQSKGIDVMFDIVREINDNYEFDATLHLIGNTDFDHSSPISNVIFHGVQDREYITKVAEKSNFFLFPSKHVGEGHSNSLTEAMQWGLVPIVSNNGFLESVVSDCGIVLDINAHSDVYVESIIDLINHKKYCQLSIAATKRVNNCYSEDAVVSSLIDFYSKLVS